MTQTTDEARREIEATESDLSESRAAQLFDLRRLIGGLFVFYGVILFIASLGTSDAQFHKAQGVNINMWTGLGMLAVGGFFLAWSLLSPFRFEEPAADKSRRTSDRRG